MPTEMRHLIFSHAEVVQAIRLYQSHLGTPMPAGTITSCTADLGGSGKAARFSITFVPDPVERRGQLQPEQAATRYLVTEGPALAAALLLFCQSKAIPMAAKAEKKLGLMGKKVCLIATINLQSADVSVSDMIRV